MKELKNAMIGLLVGDALGVPYEFSERDRFRCCEMTGYGTYDMPPGTFSDDGSMALATLDSINRKGKIDVKDIADSFIRWYKEGKYTQYDEVFDVGNTTSYALDNYLLSENPYECGLGDYFSNGNGSLMRILPVAFIEHTDEDVDEVSGITHANVISRDVCKIYVRIVENLIKGMNKTEAVKSATRQYLDYIYFSNLHGIEERKRHEIKSTGFVEDSLEAALWCFLNTISYRDCVLLAVNLGGDTDTIAAIAGGLAGLYYGIGGKHGIPNEWVRKTVNRKWIKDILNGKEAKI